MLDRLSADIARHTVEPWSETAVPRLSLVALDELPDPIDLLYDPMVCFIADGTKRAAAGEQSWTSTRGDMAFNTLRVPVTASCERLPYRSVVMRLDGRVITELLLELGESGHRPLPGPGGQVTAEMTPELLDSVTRWVRLLDSPEDIGPLAARIESEILYRLLKSPLGPALRQFTVADSGAARIRAAAAWICEHYTEPLSVDEIAAVAHMSTATLHRRFKAATGMSPLRFQKQLRLQEARRLLTAGETTAASVARAVGYVSATQFSREYRSWYGLPPMRDAGQLRGRLAQGG
ncbi:AraC family transcriptional regulator [Streptomyces qinzhouensis]|uniref:AraC family transcriptional regulator n=1 Tax=Streptomyces qinzhouensis TaxID=2599401 RepID=A0A5B8JKG1_9ACTN|nr:AraC family transcriptional regulator [Streptomyces qinzhouensis]QDY78003.1 AraC family transcriptional regulator [Streptomyces qinzhouensis]